MYPELTNLLPEERVRLSRREYFLRLTTIGTLLATMLVVLHGVLLFPAYVYLTQNIQAASALLTSIDTKLASSNQSGIEKRVQTLSTEMSTLTTLGTTASASGVLQHVLAIPSRGITLTAFSFKPAGSKGPGTIVLTGIATSRDTLRAYQLALQSAPFAAGVDLPVSAYAKDTHISFTVTVTLTKP